MLNIQVSHSYFLRYDPKQWERGKPYPPLATLQIAALLRERGHALSLFDAMLADDVEDYTPALRAAQLIWWCYTKTTSTSSPRCA